MTTSVIVWLCFTIFCYILQPVCTASTRTSKACYGALGPSCVQHAIICSSNQTIAIYDAYYTYNTDCGQGITVCNAKFDTVIELGHHRFNNAEMVSLYNSCSKETQCVYRAPRRNAALTFSVVKYQCIKSTSTGTKVNHVSSTEDTRHVSTGTRRSTISTDVTSSVTARDYTQTESSAITTTSNIVSTVTRANSTRTADQSEDDTGGIIGGVVATVLAVLVVTLVSVGLIRKRQAKREVKEKTASFPKDVQPDMTYSLAGKLPQNNYHEIQDLKTQNSNYDYATADGIAIPTNADTYFILEPACKQNTEQFSTSSTTECDYDHIGEKQSQQTSDYDTTASVAQSTHTGETIGEDNYGYNLFHKKTNPQTHQNDYDTAASATKAVAQLTRTDRNTEDDD